MPVHVVQDGWELTKRRIEALPTVKANDGQAVLRMAEAGPYVSANSNFILDVGFAGAVSDCPALAAELNGLTGVVANGMFLQMASVAIIAGAGGLEAKERGSMFAGAGCAAHER